MKKILAFILAMIFILSFSGCGNKNEETVFVDNIVLSDFISNYNSSLRSDNNTVVLWETTDSEYISCAKTLIDKILKNPSGAVYNDSYIVEKDSYGRAIVCLDVSAQNGFGGYVRKEYLVCIQKVRNDDFTYYEHFFWTENSSITSLETLKTFNDFGISPNDLELEGQFIEEEKLSFANSFLVSENSFLTQYYYNAKYFDWEIYANESSNIVSVAMSFSPQNDSLPKYQLKNNITSVISILIGVKEEKAEKISEEIFDYDQMSPTKKAKEHTKDWLCECVFDEDNITFYFTSVASKDYKDNYYWSPLTANTYFENLAQNYFENDKYESAITFFEQAGINSEDLLSAYYEMGNQLFKDNCLEDAVYYYSLAEDYKDAKEKTKEVYYTLAKEYEESGEYYSAYLYYDYADDYLDASDKQDECCYKFGNQLFEEKDYVDAAAYFSLSNGYENANEMENECNYVYGTQQLSIGNTDVGIEYLQKCRGYKDTDDIVLTVFYDRAMSDVQNYILNCNNGTSRLEYSRGGKGLELYKKAVESLKKCENYNDSSYWLEIITSIEEICVSAHYANKMCGTSYSPELTTFSVSVEEDTIILNEPNFKKSAGIQLELSFAKDKSSFSAFIPSVWYSGMSDEDACAVRMVVALFTNVFSDQTFEKYLNENFSSDDTQKTVKVEYNDYIIEITTTPSNTYHEVSITINGYLK